MSSNNLKAAAGGKDAKGKDPKAKGKAPAAGDGDQNAPKAIEIEYADDVALEKDFIVMEKTFQPKKGGPAAKKKATPKVSAPSTAGVGAKSAAGMTENSAA